MLHGEICSKCKENPIAFPESSNRYCRDCWNAYRRQYCRSKHKEAVEKLGGKCVVCGIDDIRVLQINHLHDKGHKEKLSKGAISFYRNIVNGKRSIDDLDIRCANHNILYEYESGRITG